MDLSVIFVVVVLMGLFFAAILWMALRPRGSDAGPAAADTEAKRNA